MARRISTLTVIWVLGLLVFPTDQARAIGPTVGCRSSCHNGGGSGGGSVTYVEDSFVDTSSGGAGGWGAWGGGEEVVDEPPKPLFSCTSSNGGVINMKANWSRQGSPGYTQCLTGTLEVNSCTGQFVGVGGETEVPCPEIIPPDQSAAARTYTRIRRYREICDGFEVSMTSFTCITEFDLESSVTFPGVPIHTRPYPATVVRYDTFVRIGELPSNSGSNSISYIAWEGGTELEPARGDWRFVTLTVTAYPKDPTTGFVYLEHLGWLELPVMELYKFQWQLPSHPEGGGGPLAGSVGQLEELPQDLPLLENYMRNPYGVVCELSWQEWEYNPFTDEDAWIGHTDRIEITPDKVPNLPEAYAADTNGDGKADAFWNRGVVVLRMNEANSVDDPIYGHSYSWGEVFYWAVREGQGQISFP